MPGLEEYQPAGRLVPVFAANPISDQIDLALSLGREAAAQGETVLMLDCCDGEMMDRAGIIYNKTLAEVLSRDAQLRDVKYITSNEHFTAAAMGDVDLSDILGSLAAMSLSYDWVFVLPEPGCTPAHLRLASAADSALLTFDIRSDKFMRAYWMIEAVRRRTPKFDPFLLSTGTGEDIDETVQMLSETIREHLGAPPPYLGHFDNLTKPEALLAQLTDAVLRKKVA